MIVGNLDRNEDLGEYECAFENETGRTYTASINITDILGEKQEIYLKLESLLISVEFSQLPTIRTYGSFPKKIL